MSFEQGTQLRNGKVISFMSEENTSSSNVMAESNTVDSDTNDSSDISSQLTEMKENYERKISELQSEFSQLKNLMMAVISKSNNVPRQVPKIFRSGIKWVLTMNQL